MINSTIIGSDNGLMPIQRQAIILNKIILLSSGQLGKTFSEISFKIKQSHTRIWMYK